MPAIDPSQSRSSLHSGSRWRRSSAAVLAGSVLIVAMGNTAVDADELDDLFGPVTVDAVEFYAPTADAEPVPAARTAMLFETPASPPAGPGGDSTRRLGTERQPESSAMSLPTAATLRQVHALAAAQLRQARLEAARWGGQPILRPTWGGLGGPGHAMPSAQPIRPIYFGGGWLR